MAGSFITESLIEGEELLYETSLSVWSLLGNFLLSIALFSVAFVCLMTLPDIFVIAVFLLAVAGVWALGKGLYRFYSTELCITNNRIIGKFGFYGRETMDLLIEKVEIVNAKDTFMGHFLGYGTILISGANASIDYKVDYIARPHEFKNHYIAIGGGRN